jgi:predicted esterase
MRSLTAKSLISLLLSAFLMAPLQAGEDSIVMSGGQAINVLFFKPMEVVSPPLAVMVSGGNSNEFMARAQYWLGKELVDRGWAVAVPISPEGRHFFIEHAEEFPQIIKDLQQIHGLMESKPLLVGVSSGGSAALEIASAAPDQYMGVVATPGRMSKDLAQTYLDGLPVYIRIGEKDDLRWNRQLHKTVARLQSAGAVVNAELVAGARHIFPVNWVDLEAWLATTLQGH